MIRNIISDLLQKKHFLKIIFSAISKKNVWWNQENELIKILNTDAFLLLLICYLVTSRQSLSPCDGESLNYQQRHHWEPHDKIVS